MLLSLVQFREVGKSSIPGKCARVYHYQYSRTFPALPDIFSLALRSYTSSITGEREEKRWERLIPSCDLSQEYERMRKQIGCPGSRRSTWPGLRERLLIFQLKNSTTSMRVMVGGNHERDPRVPRKLTDRAGGDSQLDARPSNGAISSCTEPQPP